MKGNNIMATDKLFTVAGTATHAGITKVRFANDMTRVKILAKTDTDIQMLDLPRAMTKGELVVHLKTTDLYKTPDYAAAIDAADSKYNAAPVVKVKGSAPSMDAIKARAGKKATVDA
jgi:hypothetical protein